MPETETGDAAVPDGTQDAGKIIVQNRKRNPEGKS